MKRVLLKLSIFLIFLSLTAGSSSAQEHIYISIATGSTGGTYYPLGSGIAEIINKNVKEVQVTSETGNASAANINLIGTHQIELALVQNDVAYWASQGLLPFREKCDNLRAVASLYPEHLHCVTLKESSLTDIADLKGKRVSLGAPGSGVLGDVTALLKVADIKVGEMNTNYLDFNSTTQWFKDGMLDAGFVVAGYPTSSVIDLAAMQDIDLLSFDENFMERLTEEFPYFIRDVIPAGTYRAVDRDVVTPAVIAMLICDGDLGDDLIYRITKALWENVSDLHKVHPKAALITLDTALQGLSIPLHPGAAKYYTELGIEVPPLN